MTEGGGREFILDMTPDEKLQWAAAQRRIFIDLMQSGLRLRHPEVDAEAIDQKCGEILFGVAFWRKVRELRRAIRPA